MIEVEIIKFVERVQKLTIQVPDDMNTRDLGHLHDFQKRLILTHLKQFRTYLKIKVERDWDKYLISENCPKIGKQKKIGLKFSIEKKKTIISLHYFCLCFRKRSKGGHSCYCRCSPKFSK